MELNNKQLEKLQNDPVLAVLCKDQDTYKRQLHDRGFYPLERGQEMDLYKRYTNMKRKISSTYSNTYRRQLEMVICKLHELINTMEIARQLCGKAENKVLTLPAVKFEP
jgi:hypothetical protein